MSDSRLPASRYDDSHVIELSQVAVPPAMSVNSVCPRTVDSRGPRVTMIQLSCAHLTSLSYFRLMTRHAKRMWRLSSHHHLLSGTLAISAPKSVYLERLNIDNLSGSGIMVAVRIAPPGNTTFRLASNWVVKCVR